MIKSEDNGNTYYLVNSTRPDYHNSRLFFDADSQHVYRLSETNLEVSDNFGEEGSWESKDNLMQPNYELFADPHTSGVIYGWSSDSTDLFISEDFGATFKVLESFADNITGFHKSSTAELMYTLTSKKLYKMENGDISSMKKIPVSAESKDSDNPVKISLLQNYPNPFNPSTRILYTIPSNTWVTLDIFTYTGQHVQTLTDEFQKEGVYSVKFDANRLSSGIYFYRLSARDRGEVLIKRMTLIK